MLMLSLALPAAGAPDDEAFILQQQRQKALEKQLIPQKPDVRLSAPATDDKLRFPPETPCFPVSAVTLEGTQALPHWLPLARIARQAENQCLGAQGINLVMSAVQNRLIDHGYITTRVLAPSQDLRTGRLRLVIVPGYVRQVRFTADSDSRLWLFSAFPARPGQLLDLRDIEQGLENLQRLSGTEARMDILPGEQPGESDIVIHRQQDKLWQVGLSLDDSGTRDTGRWQGGVSLGLDNPMGISDTLRLSATSGLHTGKGRGSSNYTGYYSFPFGYHELALTLSDYDYHQTVAGIPEDFRYSGKSKNISLQLSRLLHRNGNQKTTFLYGVQARESSNYINDTELDGQRRQTAAWRIGLIHRHYIQQAILDAGISYQRGTRWFGAQPAPEEYMGSATALSKILQMNAQFSLPFTLGEQSLSYQVAYQRQVSNTPLTPQERFAIGGRWTVRGFDGERTLSASHGWSLRNELAWQTPLPNQELYLGVDYGEVGGSGSEFLPGQHLAGSVLGLRGQAFHTGYDLFAGAPLSRPDGFKTSDVTLGLSLNWSY